MRKQVLAVTIGVLLVLSVFSVLQFGQIRPAQAVAEFSDGFESGQMNPAPGEWTSNTSDGGSNVLEVSSVGVYAGTYAAHAKNVAFNNYAYCLKTVTDSATRYMQMAVNVTDPPDASTYTHILFGKGDITNERVAGAALDYNGSATLWAMYYRNESTTTGVTYTGSIVTLNTYFIIEIKHYMDVSAGEVRMYVNGVEILSATGLNNTADGEIFGVCAGIQTGSGGNVEVYYDLVIADVSYIGYNLGDFALTIQSSPISVTYGINATGGYSVTAVANSVDSVQTAIENVHAYGNGTVNVPAGTYTLNSTFHFTSYGGVNIVGAGSGQTIFQRIADNDGTPYRSMIFVSGTNGLPFRITGLKLQGYVYNESIPNTGIYLRACVDFRIDNCWLDSFSGIAIYANKDFGESGNRGLIDHCNITNSYKTWGNTTGIIWGYGVYIHDDNYGLWQSITPLLGKYYGLEDIVYIEDCWFNQTRHATDCAQNGYYVLRYSNITSEIPPNYGSIDIHGDIYGRGLEAYNNTVIGAIGAPGGSQAAWIRGGENTIFNNTFVNCTYGVILYDESSPPYDVNNTYIWSNNMTGGGTAFQNSGGYTENVSYFLYPRPDYTSFTYPHPFTVSTTGTTNDTLMLDAGTYLVTVQSQVIVSGSTYNFSQWQDSSTNTTITVTLTTNTTITATYIEASVISVVITLPTNTTYDTATIFVSFTASGGTIDKKWMNCKNGTTWVYPTNITYPDFEIMTGFINGTQYTGYFWANNTEGTMGVATVMFSIEIPLQPTGGTNQLIVNVWWGSFW